MIYMAEEQSSQIFLVATPIGNLGDISVRAIEILKRVDVIVAEDTRKTSVLLAHFGVKCRMLSMHEHNEAYKVESFLQMVKTGSNIAVVSDAGTPLISDPGYHLIKAAREHGVRVTPVPGACSPIVALSVSGMPTDRFVFEGFLPAKKGARERYLQEIAAETGTMVFLESCHRIVDFLQSVNDVLGVERKVFIARELTKTFETTKLAAAQEILGWVKSDPNQQKGEFVVVIAGAEKKHHSKSTDWQDSLKIMLEEGISVKDAVKIIVRIYGEKKREVYNAALLLKI